MEIKKIFLTVYAEKKWLEEQAKIGYELKKHSGTTYLFEKSDKKVFYRYIFLKKGRKSFLALDHKTRDPKCSLVYGNGYVALFKREDAYPEILSHSDLKLNYLKHRQGGITRGLCALSLLCAAVALARVLAPFWAAAAVCAFLSCVYMIDAKNTDKMIKEVL